MLNVDNKKSSKKILKVLNGEYMSSSEFDSSNNNSDNNIKKDLKTEEISESSSKISDEKE